MPDALCIPAEACRCSTLRCQACRTLVRSPKEPPNSAGAIYYLLNMRFTGLPMRLNHHQQNTVLLSSVRVHALSGCASKQSDALIAFADGWWACLLRAYALPIGGKLGQVCIRDICRAVQQPNKVCPPIHVLSLQQS